VASASPGGSAPATKPAASPKPKKHQSWQRALARGNVR